MADHCQGLMILRVHALYNESRAILNSLVIILLAGIIVATVCVAHLFPLH